MKMKEKTKNKIIELYKNGETIANISKKLDVWNNHCCYVLIKEGLYKYKRKITPITEDMIEQFVELYKEGYSFEKIGRKYNTTGRRVAKYINLYYQRGMEDDY